MELTKEYFEQHLAELFEKFEKKMDNKFAEQTADLKVYVHESFEVQQNYINYRFEELTDSLQVISHISLK